MEPSLLTEESYTFYNAKGCIKCNNTGYRGRIAVIEVFEVDPEIKSMIFEDVGTVKILNHAIENGMITLKEDMFHKILDGITSLEEYERTIL